MTAKGYFEQELSGEPLTQDAVIEALIEFGKLWAANGYKSGLSDFEELDRNFDPSERYIGEYEFTQNFLKRINIE